MEDANADLWRFIYFFRRSITLMGPSREAPAALSCDAQDPHVRGSAPHLASGAVHRGAI